MQSRTPPEVLAVRTAARSQMFHIEAVRLRFTNGAEREFERIAAPLTAGTVIVVASASPGSVLMTREYAAGLERYELGLPMGGIEPGESVLQAANRELREETGFAAATLTPLSKLSLAPSILAYQAQIVLATDLYEARDDGDEPEAPEVLNVPLNSLDRLIAAGELSEARSLAALFIAREELRKRHKARSGASRVSVRGSGPRASELLLHTTASDLW
jgi:ADP-ribose diphosphatase